MTTSALFGLLLTGLVLVVVAILVSREPLARRVQLPIQLRGVAR